MPRVVPRAGDRAKGGHLADGINELGRRPYQYEPTKQYPYPTPLTASEPSAATTWSLGVRSGAYNTSFWSKVPSPPGGTLGFALAWRRAAARPLD